ncbi:MAG: TIGR02147 family protein [Pseudobdellovibrionaceae bacterium]
MTYKSIFEYIDYKAYLSSIEQSGAHKGFRSRLAETTGCQNAFISQVLNGEVNFNLEQGMRIAVFLQLNEEEHQYFLWMIEHKRAGTQELKKYFHNLMMTLREKNLEIKNRVQISQVLSTEAQTTYYSSWIYSAVHIAVMIPALNSISKIAKALNLTEEKTKSTVEFLISKGLVERNGQLLKSGRTQIHLGNDSANINKHHSNWRIESLKSLDSPNRGDLHYSGVSCLSKADAEKIRAQFVEVVENYVRQIENSSEETLFAFNLDFFQIAKMD